MLVTGGTGSIGSEIVRQLAPLGAKQLRVMSRDEFKQSKMRYAYRDFENLRFLMGDIRDLDRLHRAMEGVNIVFHAAALKRIESTEYDPLEAVKTNVMGTQNIITASLHNPDTNRVVAISTDKAVNVTTTMGATKLLAERLITWASFYRRQPHKTFCSVRFGNVLNSRGSVIPIWQEQIRNGGPLTLTHPEMRRFFMSIPNAVELTLKAAVYAEGGEIFILRMRTICIRDLAEILVEEYATKVGRSPKEIEIKVTGLTPGEKLDEELIASGEMDRTFRVDDEMAVIMSTPRLADNPYTPLTDSEGYLTGAEPMNKEDLRAYLKEEGVL